MSTTTTNLRQVAERAAESIRELNHATLNPGDLSPSEVYEILADLDVAVGRLPQLLGQLHRQVEWHRPNMRTDDGGVAEAVEHLNEIAASIAQAVHFCGVVGAELSRAMNHASHLYVRSALTTS